MKTDASAGRKVRQRQAAPPVVGGNALTLWLSAIGQPQPPAQLTQRQTRGLDAIFVVLINAFGLYVLARGLSHPYINIWDESVHQQVARGLLADWFHPQLYADPLYDVPLGHWTDGGTWLHKPTLPFWLGAIGMTALGVTPLALRLVSLVSALAAATGIFWWMRRVTGRLLAGCAAVAFLTLPFGWDLVQGFQFGDATDCTLAAALVGSLLLLTRAIETGKVRLYAATGALVGVGYLCKSALAVTPLGVAGLFFLLAWRRQQPGPDLKHLATLGAAFLVVVLPWNLYCRFHWPDLYQLEAKHTLDHLLGHVEPWDRPVDAIFNEIHGLELKPIAVVVPVLAGVWVCVRAWRRREVPVIALAAWLVLSWTALSVAHAKVPGVAWGVVPAIFAALALVLADVWESPVLAAATCAAFVTTPLIAKLPALAHLRTWVPDALPQTRDTPGLVEGVVLMSLAALAVLALQRLWTLPRWARRALALLACALAFRGGFLKPMTAQAELSKSRLNWEALRSYSKEVGEVLDTATPAKSVVFLDTDQDPDGAQETLGVMFWSGRMAWRRAPDIALAQARGYHPYLLSPAAEPYQPLPNVPHFAWLRAYDLLAPTPATAPLPPGVTPLGQRVGNLEVLGWSAGPIDATHDRYAFYVRSHGAPHPLQVVFTTPGTRFPYSILPQWSLRSPERLQKADWFVMPAFGPRHEALTDLQLGSPGMRAR